VTGHDQREGVPRQEGRGWKLYVLGIAAVVLLIFVVQNSQKVTVDFLFTETQTPLIFALLIAGALGALIGWAWPHVRRGRKYEREREQRGE
jgi:uncharacterized integral membrane protein